MNITVTQRSVTVTTPAPRSVTVTTTAPRSVTVTTAPRSVTVNAVQRSITVNSTGIRGPKGDSFEQNMVLYLASIAPITSVVGSPPTSVSYSDFNNITNHTKEITYTSGLPTTVVEEFDYAGETWTVTKVITYNAGVPASTTLTVDRVV